MASKRNLQEWIVEALRANGGSASLLVVTKHVWQVHEADLRASGDLFYTWQYDLRWAGQLLRDAGVLAPADGRRGGPWTLISGVPSR